MTQPAQSPLAPMPTNRAPKHRAFVFTEHNYDDATEERLQNDPWLSYLIYGREVCPSTGTHHLQGFIWTHEDKTKQQIIRHMKLNFIGVPGKGKGPTYHCVNDGIHTDDMGDPIGYCKKDLNWHEQGVRPTEEAFEEQIPKGQGSRTDLLSVKKAIDSGSSVEQLLDQDDHFQAFATHKKFFTEYQAHKRRRLAFEAPAVHLRHGPTGTDKTRYVYSTHGLDDIWVWNPGMGPWFDGYAGQSVVLFDEFRGDIPYGQILRYTDGYPKTKVPVKGGFIDFSPKIIYFTSPVNYDAWWPKLSAHDSLEQFARRLTSVTDTTPPAI